MNEDLEDGEIVDELKNEVYECISSDEEINLRARIRKLEEENWEIEKNHPVSEIKHDLGYTSSISPSSKYTLSSISDYEFYDELPGPKLPVNQQALNSSLNLSKERNYKVPKKLKLNSKSSKQKRKHLRTKNKAINKLYLTSSDSEEENSTKKLMLDLAIKVDNNSQKIDKEENELKKKLQIWTVASYNNTKTAGAISEDTENEELSLRLLALNSKQEMKELNIKDNNKVFEEVSNKICVDDSLNEENELRLLALKSTFRKKHEARKKRRENERPYSPTDVVLEGVDVQSLPIHKNICNENDNESNMEISPISSPILLVPAADDSLVHEIDMDLASSDDSNYSVIMLEKTPQPLSPPMPLPSPLKFYLNVISTENSESTTYFDNLPSSSSLLPTRFSNDLPPSCLTVEKSEGNIFSSDFLLSTNAPVNYNNINYNINSSNINNKQSTCDLLQNIMYQGVNSKHSVNSENEEESLRALLLSNLSTNRNTKQIPPFTGSNKVNKELDQSNKIELSLKKAVERINEKKKKCKDNNVPLSNTTVVNHDIVKLLNHEIVHNNKPIVKRQSVKTELEPTVPALVPTSIHPKLLSFAEDNNVVNNKENKCSEIVFPLNTHLQKIVKPAKEEFSQNNRSQSRKLGLTSSNIDQKQKKRKLENEGPQSTICAIEKTPNVQLAKSFKVLLQKKVIPTSRKMITNLEDYVKPVPKLVIQLGNSDSDTDCSFYGETVDDDNNNSRDSQSKLNVREVAASPCHIYYDSPVLSPAVVTNTLDNTVSVQKSKKRTEPDGKVFENKLNQYLRNVRTKIENVVETDKPSVLENKNVRIKTPSKSAAVCHLPVSSQLEYMRLKARISHLEKMRQSKLNAQEKTNKSASNELKVGNSSKENISVESAQIKEKINNNNNVLYNLNNNTNKVTNADAKIETKENAKHSTDNQSPPATLTLLKKCENNFNVHSKSFLKDLTGLINTMKLTQRSIKRNYELESQYEALQKQMKVLEAEMSVEANKIRKLYPMISSNQKKVKNARSKSIALNSICLKYGKQLKSGSYESPIIRILNQKWQLLLDETKKLNLIKTAYKNKLNKPDNTEASISMKSGESEKSANIKVTKDIPENSILSVDVMKTLTIPNPSLPDETVEQQVIANNSVQSNDQQTAITSVDSEEAKTEHKTVAEISAQPDDLMKSNSITEVSVQDSYGNLPQTVLIKVNNENQFTEENGGQISIVSFPTTIYAFENPDFDDPFDDDSMNAPFKINYATPLNWLKNECSQVANINAILCPYALSGECKDKDCYFEHFDKHPQPESRPVQSVDEGN